MKLFFALFISLLFTSVQAQENLNLKNGIAAEGYDVIAYFNNEALKGDKKYTYTYNDATYKFSTLENLETFKNNPILYVPQFGGYCAYAVAVKGKKISVNPKSFKILDDKLYLFYDRWGVNTLDKWNKEGEEELQKQADENWGKIEKKKI